MPSWTVAQIGAREHYAVPRALARQGELHALFTDVWAGGRWHALLQQGPPALRALGSRYHPELADERVIAFTAQHLLEALWQPLARRLDPSRTVHDAFLAIGDRFDRSVRGVLERSGPLPPDAAFFSYNTGCLRTIEWLNGQGIPSVVAQIDPGRVEQELVFEEMERWPGWADAAPEIHESYYRRLEAEWAAATRVLVNSEWSRDALVQQGVPAEKIVTVPLAYEPPAAVAERPPAPADSANGPLRVLWLGQVVLRKGIQYLIEAAKRLPPADFEFVIAGPIGITDRGVAAAPPNMTFLGRITRDRLSEVYGAADVFVLPTLSDGFAITQLEAMAHGLPVVATPSCARVVTDGADGLIVPAADAEALAEALAWCHEHRGDLPEMGERARQKLKAYTLEAYANRLGQAYASVSAIP